MSERFEKHLPVSTAGAAIDLLAEQVALSRQQLKTAMMQGAVWLESGHGVERIRRAKKRIKPGDTLHLITTARCYSNNRPPPVC